MNVAILDYGMGNILSVTRAISKCGGKPIVTADPLVINRSDALILPGVGAFGEAMKEISKRGLHEAISSFAQSGRPILGICLGMQVLANKGYEFGEHSGLGLIDGCIVSIPIDDKNRAFKRPNIGWYETTPNNKAIWNQGYAYRDDYKDSFYFVHSYHFVTDSPEHSLASYRLGNIDVTAVVGRENIIGTQFHPEKSGASGLNVIRHFLNTQ